MDKHCSCKNCFNPVVAKGLCNTHYNRQKKHGSTEQTRPADWGKREKHPLYNSWTWMRRMRGRHQIEESWDDFWTYVADIGKRPSEKHKLYKIKPELGYTKGNVVWKEIWATTEDRAAYAKAWREANPDKAKNSELKQMFGISLDDYNAMREKQNYSCAICGKHEQEEPTNLSVDHCHETGKVRGLLCSNCNRGLGYFKDNVSFLKNAVNYLGD